MESGRPIMHHMCVHACSLGLSCLRVEGQSNLVLRWLAPIWRTREASCPRCVSRMLMVSVSRSLCYCARCRSRSCCSHALLNLMHLIPDQIVATGGIRTGDEEAA
eukprot:365040-Chlamydomonas_euryale.AAC.16